MLCGEDRNPSREQIKKKSTLVRVSYRKLKEANLGKFASLVGKAVRLIARIEIRAGAKIKERIK